MFSPPEQEIARSLVTTLRSDKYKDRNYLFLAPFDITVVPGYLDVVSKPLDLQTVHSNLDSNVYPTMESFMADLNGIFHNAIRYHGTRETKWIAKMAKEMLKVTNKEKQKLENPKKATIKLKLGKTLPKAAGVVVSSSPLPTATLSAPAVRTDPLVAEEAAVAATPKKPKLKLKLAAATSKKPPTPLKAVKAKPTQPKLKLKLSLSKAKAPLAQSPAVAPEAAPSAPLPEAVTSENPKAKATKPTKGGSSGTPKAAAAKAKETTKLSVKIGAGGGAGSRGKELPRGVVAPAAKTPVSTATSSGASTAVGGETTKQRKSKPKKAPLSPAIYRQCHKVLLGLRRRAQKDVSWFLSPVTDKNLIQDYRAKIKYPMDISKITTKLENGSYSNLNDFCLDLRRICANCLRFNTSVKDSIRHSAARVLKMNEYLLMVFLATPDCPAYPRLLYCWRLCINVLDTLYNLVNPNDGQPTVLYFLHPVSIYCGGQFPAGYLDKIPKPMDFGTLTSNLVEGRCKSVADFANGCKLIIQNTKTYYGDREDGKLFVEQADRLDQVLSQQLEQLARYDQSAKGQSDRQKAMTPELPLPRPTAPLLLSIMGELRTMSYTDKATKITEPAVGPFEKPVSLTVFPDYLQHVSEPMDLQTVDKRIKSGVYVTPEDFEYDVTLAFRNCEVYNSKRNGDHFVVMAKFATRKFRILFYAKIRTFEDPASAMPVPDGVGSGEMMQPPSKKIKIDTSAAAMSGGVSKGKTAPRITLSLAAVSAAAKASSKSPRPGSALQKKVGKPPTSNQPIPLHIAISRVKETFPLRRAVKNLQAMEADLAKYLKDLMRHQWLSAARPRFIFHVPVPLLFPELREAYAAKIRKPMDLVSRGFVIQESSLGTSLLPHFAIVDNC
jgi:hypothetical protein